MSETPPVPAQEPALSPTPAPVPAQPPRVACPNCFTIVAPGTTYCPNCGNAIPPSWPSVPQPVVAQPPRKPRTALIVGIVLLVLLVLGGAGYFAFRNFQQNPILQAAKNSEQTAANNAPNQLQFTCLSVATDSSHLTTSAYGGYSGYATISETFGLSNPTRFPMDSTWTITLDYTSVNLVLPATSTFHIAASGTARPVFPFTIMGSQYNSFPPHPDFSKFTVTLDATFHVTGTYSTYTVTQHATYDSSTGTGTGSLGSTASLRSC